MQMQSSKRWCRYRSLLFIVVASILSACGGGGASETNTQSPDNFASVENEKASLALSLTDAEGDFLEYRVVVESIELVRANGAVVNVLPQSSEMDFAQYVEVSELVTLQDVPAGIYRSAELVLNYSNASVVVQGSDGEAVPASLIDSEGQTLTTLPIALQFGDRDGFVLTPRVVSHIMLDFDLDASHTITFGDGTAEVVVDPIIVSDAVHEAPKTTRKRGLLNAVSVENSAFSLNLRPFRHTARDHGAVRVYTDGDTEYEIDGAEIAPDEGLSVMADLPPASAVVAEGVWQPDLRRFVAARVLAGDSVPWSEADILRGTVVARSADVITLRGTVIELREGPSVFRDELTLEVSEATRFFKRGDENANAGDMAIGTALHAIGNYGGDTFSAADGIVRIRPSQLSGRVRAVSPLAIDLALINGRRATLFDFMGTGSSAETDADPEFYELATGSLPLDQLDLDQVIRARGFVAEFGAAPEDFLATTLITPAAIRGHLVARYRDSDAVPLTVLEDDNLELDVSTGGQVIWASGGIRVDLGENHSSVTLGTQVRGIYSLHIDNRHTVYTQVSDFTEDLGEAFSDGATVVRLDVHGKWSPGTSTLNTHRISLRLDSPISE